MGQAVPRQQPAVVLRSHFNQLRALLAVALTAVAGLTVAVAIVASDSDELAVGTAARSPLSCRIPALTRAPAARSRLSCRRYRLSRGHSRPAPGSAAEDRL
jgi:hypothetical protein